MRLSSKTIVKQTLPSGKSLQSDFYKSDIYATIRDKGYDVIHEKVYICPCKSKNAVAVLQDCENCGGSGWVFANPTKTKMLLKGISNQRKYEQQGQEDLGMVEITAWEEDKLSKMDRITIIDGTTEHKEVLYPSLKDDDSQRFAYTKYNIKSIDNIAVFIDSETKLTRLTEVTDYTFYDNVILFNASFNSNLDMSVTIRYVHAPVYHVWDISRDSMRSTVVTNGKSEEIVLPVHALGKRAHLIQDAENFTGNRLLDNSWLPDACEAEELTKFQRQLLHSEVSDIYDSLSANQKAELALLIAADGTILGANGGVLQINP